MNIEKCVGPSYIFHCLYISNVKKKPLKKHTKKAKSQNRCACSNFQIYTILVAIEWTILILPKMPFFRTRFFVSGEDSKSTIRIMVSSSLAS